MKCSDITLQKILDLAVHEGFLTANASREGIEHSKGFLFSEENSSFLKSLKNAVSYTHLTLPTNREV